MRHAAILFLGLFGCAAVPQDPAGPAEDSLARALDGRVAGAAARCIPVATSIRSLAAIERRAIVYRQGQTVWVNRLSEECPGFHPIDTLIVEARSGRYCRDDLIRAATRASSIPGPSCVLGEWVPYRNPS